MDGSWLAFASLRSGDYGLRAVRVDGTCERPLVTAPTLELHPAVSSKGRLAFTSDRSGALRIWQVSPGAGEPSLLDTGDLRATSPAYSPDGATIAFEGQPTGAATTDLYVVPAAGGTPTPLAADPADDAGPAWSPDGSTLYFVSTRSGGYEIHSVVVATGAVSQLTTGSRIVGRPAVGPAGDRLYFARTVAVSTDTEVVRLVLASGVIEVVSSEQDSEPAVSPSGTRLALRTFRYGAANADLVLVNESDGGSAVRLTSNAGSDGSPAFFPRR
jgi:TolB protein